MTAPTPDTLTDTNGPRNAAQQFIVAHLVSGDLSPGSEIGLRIDQTLTHRTRPARW